VKGLKKVIVHSAHHAQGFKS